MALLPSILEYVWKKHTLTDSAGIFISCFSSSWSLLISNWVLVTDKPLQKVIEMIYNGLIAQQENTIHTIICDIVTHIEEKTTIDSLNSIDISTQGICIQTIDNAKSSVLLPWTIGIHNLPEAIATMKKKYTIDGNINIYSFSTDRISITA